jgi:hypothetical protein
LALLKLKGAIGSAFVDGRFKYYGSDATIKERVREKREAELKRKHAKRRSLRLGVSSMKKRGSGHWRRSVRLSVPSMKRNV